MGGPTFFFQVCSSREGEGRSCGQRILEAKGKQCGSLLIEPRVSDCLGFRSSMSCSPLELFAENQGPQTYGYCGRMLTQFRRFASW